MIVHSIASLFQLQWVLHDCIWSRSNTGHKNVLYIVWSKGAIKLKQHSPHPQQFLFINTNMKNLKQQYQKQTYMCNTQARQLYSPFSFQKNITAIIAATIGIPHLNPTVWTTHDEEVVWTKKKTRQHDYRTAIIHRLFEQSRTEQRSNI